jgi:hypothetical protein
MMDLRKRGKTDRQEADRSVTNPTKGVKLRKLRVLCYMLRTKEVYAQRTNLIFWVELWRFCPKSLNQLQKTLYS